MARSQEQFDIRYGGVEKVKWIPYDALEPLTFPYVADYVIHCAGIANPALYVSAPVETMLSNVYGVMELLEYSKKHKVKKFMYISSGEVYGRSTQDRPVRESEKKMFNPMDNASLNNEKVKKLGYSDTFTVEEGLTHTVQIIREML